MYTPEQNLQLSNLVSRGVKMADAKKKLGLDKVDAKVKAEADAKAKAEADAKAKAKPTKDEEML